MTQAGTPLIKEKPEIADAELTAPEKADRSKQRSEREKARNAIAAEEAKRRDEQVHNAKQNKANLDKGLEDSMDASDPPSSVQP